MKIKNKVYIITIVGFIIGCIIIFILYKQYSISPQTIEQNLYSLNPSVTIEQMEKKGFINISGIQKGENKTITKFLIDAKNNNKSLLKLLILENDKMYLRVFYSDPEKKEIRGWTYLPWEQKAISPNKKFLSSYSTLEEDGIVTIKLINIKDDELPMEQALIDETLYSYYQ